MTEPRTVTQGTALTGAAGTGATVAVGAETVTWLWARATTGAWPDMPVSTAALLGVLATGLLTIVTYVVYGALVKWGLIPRQMFPQQKEPTE